MEEHHCETAQVFQGKVLANDRPVYRSCNLCGYNWCNIVSSVDRYGLPIRTVKCYACELVYIDPIPSKHAYAELYKHYYRPMVDEWSDIPMDPKQLVADQEGHTGAVIEFTSDQLDVPRGKGRLLDIGGSIGIMAKRVADAYGMEPTVVDPAPSETAQANCRAYTSTWEDWDVDGPYELLMCFQTLEHFWDLKYALEKMRRVCVGNLLCDVVDFNDTLRQYDRRNACKIDHPYQLTYATASSFLEKAGFEITHHKRFGRHIFFICR